MPPWAFFWRRKITLECPIFITLVQLKNKSRYAQANCNLTFSKTCQITYGRSGAQSFGQVRGSTKAEESTDKLHDKWQGGGPKIRKNLLTSTKYCPLQIAHSVGLICYNVRVRVCLRSLAFLSLQGVNSMCFFDHLKLGDLAPLPPSPVCPPGKEREGGGHPTLGCRPSLGGQK